MAPRRQLRAAPAPQRHLNSPVYASGDYDKVTAALLGGAQHHGLGNQGMLRDFARDWFNELLNTMAPAEREAAQEDDQMLTWLRELLVDTFAITTDQTLPDGAPGLTVLECLYDGLRAAGDWDTDFYGTEVHDVVDITDEDDWTWDR